MKTLRHRTPLFAAMGLLLVAFACKGSQSTPPVADEEKTEKPQTETVQEFSIQVSGTRMLGSGCTREFLRDTLFNESVELDDIALPLSLDSKPSEEDMMGWITDDAEGGSVGEGTIILKTTPTATLISKVMKDDDVIPAGDAVSLDNNGRFTIEASVTEDGVQLASTMQGQVKENEIRGSEWFEYTKGGSSCTLIQSFQGTKN